jgi:homoserine dehydrogenase
VLASEQISIETVQQKSKGGPTVPLVILTHEAGEAALSRAIGQLNSLDTVRSPVQMIRLENI